MTEAVGLVWVEFRHKNETSMKQRQNILVENMLQVNNSCK